jgi:hypothetical protein
MPFPDFFVALENGFVVATKDFMAAGDETASRCRDLVRTEIDIGLHADREISSPRQSNRNPNDIQFGLIA